MKHNDPDSKLPVSVLDENNLDTYLHRLNHYLALGSLIGGSTLLLTKTLIPSAVKSSNS